jgi:hypothetical protein
MRGGRYKKEVKKVNMVEVCSMQEFKNDIFDIL